jgi:hypothetical protein
VFPVSLWFLTRVLSTFAHEAAGASGARHFLRPLFSRDEVRAQLGRIAPRDGGCLSRFAVIACDKREAFAQGSESDEAIQLSHSRVPTMDCFACVRNDAEKRWAVAV